jgi:hypothetical protein
VATRKGALATLLLLAGGLGLAFLVPETALRLAGYVPARVPATGRMANPRWTMLVDCYPTNPRGYFDIDLRTPPSREKYFGLAPLRFDRLAARAPWAVEFRYNEQRFRDRAPSPKPPGVRRVAILGDSFTEGQGVKEQDTAARRLGAALEATDAGRWETVNCGRRGADFPALYDQFVDALAFEPDVLVYAFVPNDAARSPAFQAGQSYLDDWIMDRAAMVEEAEVPGPRFLESRLFAFVGDRVASYRVSRATTRWYLDMYGAPNSKGWEETQAYLRAMNRKLRERGARFVVMSWPLLVGLEGGYAFSPVHETLHRFCVKEGIAHLDLLRFLAGRPSASLWVHPVDRHPNEVAQAIAAEALLPVVRDLADRP